MPPPRTRPVANQALASLIEQAGWTHGAVADHVNSVAAETGDHPLFYDRSAVGHWLTGTIPRPEAVAAAVEAFRRVLHRPDLAPADLGWEAVILPPAGNDPWKGDPVARLATLGEDDMLNRRTLLAAGAFTVAGLTPAISAGGSPRERRGGAGDAQRIRSTTMMFAGLDDQYGGGHARAAVAAYLTRDVAPLLRGTGGRPRQDLFCAAAELTYLAAYMAMDAGAHDLAARYYISTIRLASEAGDAVLRATGLRSMAVAATERGRHSEAFDLAEAAASSLRGGGPERTRAWVRGMQAEAAAGVGGRWDALNLLRQAEAQLEHADSLPEAEWTGNYRRESLEHQTGLTLTALGDHATAARHYAASMATRRPVERRTQALIGLRAAHACLFAGDVDQAAATVLNLGADVRSISSARVRREVRQLRADWQPYRSSSHVAAADRVIASN